MGTSRMARDCAGSWNKQRSEEHTSELQSQSNLVCRLLLEKKVQDDLFTVGAELAMAHASEESKVPRVTPDHVARLEVAIDSLDIGRVTEFIGRSGSDSLVR